MTATKRSTPDPLAKKKQDEQQFLKELQTVFAASPEGTIACDREGNILFMNVAAYKLFDVPLQHSYIGTPYRTFLGRYEICDKLNRPIFLAPWLLDLAQHKDTKVHTYNQAFNLGLSSGKKVPLEMYCSPATNAERQVIGMTSIFHEITPRYQQAIHLQRVYEAIAEFNQAITRLPEQLQFTFVADTILLSPPLLFISQKLVEVIYQVLDCWRVSLGSFSSPEYRYYYIAGCGFPPEEDQHRRETRGSFSYLDFVGKDMIKTLQENQFVIISSDRIAFPPGAIPLGAANVLCLPVFLQNQLAGALAVYKEGWDSGFSQEEIDLTEMVIAQATLILECLASLPMQSGLQARDMIIYEVNRLSKEFLTLASHELRTPLTAIKGNLQLAQRQLEMLKRQIAEQSDRTMEFVERTQQSLASAANSTRTQERMLQDIIDDALIQANQLHLHLKPNDLLVLVEAAIMRKRQTRPEREILLDVATTLSPIPVLADGERIIQVLTIFMTNAINYSPSDQPVTVKVMIEENWACVSVHDKGPGVTAEEQKHIWERFYRGKGSGVQHELDLSLGLSLYLCRELIERHDGRVGVESLSSRGATFWFLLPLHTDEETEKPD